MSGISTPELNATYATLLAHYGVVADPARVADSNRKGTVESAIQHTQSTALKGRRFESIEEQNAFLLQWEERWAAPRIHGRKKRQVSALFAEEQPHLQSLPLEGFRFFRQEVRTVDDSGLVQAKGSYYAALPAAPHTEVTVRIYAQSIEVLDAQGSLLRRHALADRKGRFVMEETDRLFNPSRDTDRLMRKVMKIGPASSQLAGEIFARLGRPGQRAIYGLSQLPRRYAGADIEAACAAVLLLPVPSYQALRRVLERRAEPAVATGLAQSGDDIRQIDDYHAFWEQYALGMQTTEPHH